MKSASECGVDIVARTNGACNIDHRKVVQLALNAADHAKRLAKIHLRMPRRMSQRHKNFLGAPLLFAHIIGDDGDPAREPMLVSQPGMDALGRMALFLDPGFVLLENLINDRNKRIQLRARKLFAAPVSRRH